MMFFTFVWLAACGPPDACGQCADARFAESPFEPGVGTYIDCAVDPDTPGVTYVTDYYPILDTLCDVTYFGDLGAGCIEPAMCLGFRADGE